jgi:hypothetical protein
MHSQLTHQMARIHQQDLHRAGERARTARAVSRDGRFAALCRRIMNTSFSHSKPQPQASRPVAGAVSET